MPVTKAIIQQKALPIRDSLLQTTCYEPTKAKLRRFRVSNGLVSKFVKRHALHSVSKSRKAGSA